MNKNFTLLMVLVTLLITGCTQKQSAVLLSDVPFVHPNDTNVFDLTAMPTVKVTIKVADWDSLLLNYDRARKENYWIPADYEFTKEDGEVITLLNSGLRIRGNSSRQRPEGEEGDLHTVNNTIWNQCSFSVNFKKYVKGQKFYGLEKLRLKYVREDPTRIREVYSFNLHKLDNQFTAPRISFCKFYIHIEGDDNPAYFGLYKLMENIDEDYITNRKEYFGNKGSKGFLWKGDNNADLINNDRNVMGVEGDNIIYELKTNDDDLEAAQDQLIAFIDNLNNLTGSELKTWAENTMDVNLFLRTYAINVICGNQDDYWYHSNNYNFYFNVEGKFFFIPNDYDTTLGTWWCDVENLPDVAKQDIYNWGGENPLVRNLLTIPEFKQMYTQAFYDLAEGPFSAASSAQRITTWRNMIQPYLVDDTTDDTPFADTPAFWACTEGDHIYYLVEHEPGTDTVENYFTARINSLPALNK